MIPLDMTFCNYRPARERRLYSNAKEHQKKNKNKNKKIKIK
jgi:hypothetical protein